MNVETKILIRNRAISTAPWMAEIIEELKLMRYFATIRNKGYSLPLPGLIKRSIIQAEAIRIRATDFIETGTRSLPVAPQGQLPGTSAGRY